LEIREVKSRRIEANRKKFSNKQCHLGPVK
jgi:hypothetical protein